MTTPRRPDQGVIRPASLPPKPARAGGLDRDASVGLRIKGRDVPVFASPVGAFALWTGDATARVEIERDAGFGDVVVRPLSHGIAAEADGRRVSFTLPSPAGPRAVHLSIEFDGDLRRPLWLLASPPEASVPDGPNVRRYGAGVHEVGVVELADGETVHIAEGAVVRGAFTATGKRGITVRGRGVIDGSNFDHGPQAHQRLLEFIDCTDLTIEGVTLYNCPRWNLVPVGCRGVRISEVKIVNWSNSGDGFDIVGSSDVLLERCFARCKDDCVAIKAITVRHPEGGRDVEDVLVRGCTFWNAEWGNAIEIGYETQCDHMRRITFEDIDIIRCEPERYTSGGAITIHNGDRARISQIVYRNIRLEDVQHKLFDFKVTSDKYTRDPVRGHIGDILIEDVAVVDGALAPSILQGYGCRDGDRNEGNDRMLENITFRNLTYRGRPLRTQLDAAVITERCRDVTFE